MEITHLFSGNALGAVDKRGRVRLPPFILNEIGGCGGPGRLLFGVHAEDPCVTGYGAALKPRLHAELERRRLRDEEAGLAPDAHHARTRRLFGLVEEGAYDEAGRIALPSLARRRAGIGEAILFIGAGTHFELWDPGLALREGSQEVRALAAYRLDADGFHSSEEEESR